MVLIVEEIGVIEAFKFPLVVTIRSTCVFGSWGHLWDSPDRWVSLVARPGVLFPLVYFSQSRSSWDNEQVLREQQIFIKPALENWWIWDHVIRLVKKPPPRAPFTNMV